MLAGNLQPNPRVTRGTTTITGHAVFIHNAGFWGRCCHISSCLVATGLGPSYACLTNARAGGKTSMTDNAIEISGLSKTYAATGRTAAKTALHDINMNIPRGMVFGLLGPNGAGQSTLINILAGLVTKTAGTVKIWGFDQDENPRQSRAAIGIMPQEPHLDPFFTPAGSLDVQAGLYGVPKSQRKTLTIKVKPMVDYKLLKPRLFLKFDGDWERECAIGLVIIRYSVRLSSGIDCRQLVSSKS